MEGALVCSRFHMLRLRVRALAFKVSFRFHRCVVSLSLPLPVLCLPFNLLLLDAVAGSIFDGASSGSFEASHPATTSNAPGHAKAGDFYIPANRWTSLEQLAVEPSADRTGCGRGEATNRAALAQISSKILRAPPPPRMWEEEDRMLEMSPSVLQAVASMLCIWRRGRGGGYMLRCARL